MKKATLVAGGLLAFGLPLLGTMNASATDLTGKLVIQEGGSTQLLENPVWSYDAENDVNRVHLITSLSQEKLNSILNYRAGSPASQAQQGVIFITLDVNAIQGGENNPYAWSRGTGWLIKQPTIAEAFDDIDAGKTVSKINSVWPFSFFVQYKDGDKWVSLSNGGRMTDGSQTVAELLNAAKPGTYDVSTYNDTWRVSAYTAFQNLWKFDGYDLADVEGEKIKADAVAKKTERVALSYEIKFPVSGTTNEANKVETYFVDLGKALQSDATVVTVNENMTISNPVTVPEGKKLAIAKDVKVTLEGTGEIKAAEGQIIGEGKVVKATAGGEEQVYPIVKPEASEKTVESSDKSIKVSGILPSDVAKVEIAAAGAEWNLTGDEFKDSDQKVYEIKLVDNNGQEVSANGATLTVELDIPKAMADKVVNVYYIKETADGKPNGFELLQSAKENGKVKFVTTHFSKYALVASETPKDDGGAGSEEDTKDPAVDSPETGVVAKRTSAKSGFNLFFVAIASLVAGGAALAVKYYKKNVAKAKK